MPNAEAFYAFIRTELDAIREAGLFKQERVIASPQAPACAPSTAGRSSTCAQTTTWACRRIRG